MLDRLLYPIIQSYLKDYLINFSLEDFQTNSLGGFSFSNLLISPKVLDNLGQVPIRLKFGMIGKLAAKLNAGVFDFQKGLQIEISDLVICLEQLDVEKWEDGIVIDMYRGQKEARLRDQIQNAFNKYENDALPQQDQNDRAQEQGGNTMLTMIRNSDISIKRLSIIFEDDDFYYQIGLLLPSIVLKSKQPGEKYASQQFEKYVKPKNQISNDEYEAKLQSKLEVKDVSIFVDQKQKENFQEISFDAWIKTQKLDKKKNDQNDKYAEFQNADKWTKEESKRIFKALSDKINTIFEDSARRMETKRENYYIFSNVLQIELETEYLFLSSFKQSINDLLDFFCTLAIKSSSNKQGISPQIDVSEHQLNALLHIGTLFSAFSSYSEGVIDKRYRKEEKFQDDMEKYEIKFKEYIQFKIQKNEKQATEKFKELLKLAENHKIESVYKFQKILTEYYFKQELKKNKFERENPKNSGLTKLYYGDSTDDPKYREAYKIYDDERQQIDEERKKKISDYKVKLKNNQKEEIYQLDQEADQKKESNELDKRNRIIFELDQLNLNLTSQPEIGGKHKTVKLSQSTISKLFVFMKQENKETQVEFKLNSLNIKDINTFDYIKEMHQDKGSDFKLNKNAVSQYFVKTDDNKTDDRVHFGSNRQDNLLNMLFISSKDYSKLDLNVDRPLNIYANIYHLNYLIDFAARIMKDMVKKKKAIIEKAKNDEIKNCIRQGFQYLNRISKIYEEQKQQLNEETTLQTKRNSFDYEIKMQAPRLVFDEYLMAAQVVNPERPFYFLLDMGTWEIFNSVDSCEVETTKDDINFYRGKTVNSHKRTNEGTYFSLNMIMSDMQILYNFTGVENFFKEQKEEMNFKICEKLQFGFQYQNLIKSAASKQCPLTQINLKFQQFHLNYERSVFRELLKLKTFVGAGSYQKHLDKMNEEDGEAPSQENKSDLVLNDQSLSCNIKSSLLESNSDQNKKKEDPKDQGETRINLIFYEIEIRKQEVKWKNNNTVVEQSSILKIGSDTFYISMSSLENRTTVVVLLKELDFMDLVPDSNVKYKDILTHADKKRLDSLSKRLLKPSKETKEFFNEFQNKFEPRYEYTKNDFQVSVMYRSQTSDLNEDEINGVKICSKKQNSWIFIKMQHIQLISHWDLISDSNQVVFNILDDLTQVEEMYTSHLVKQKQIGDLQDKEEKDDKQQEPDIAQIDIKLTNKQSKIQKPKNEKKQDLGMKERFITQESELIFDMPEFKLIVPQKLEEDDQDLKLCMESSIRFESHSQQHVHQIYVEEKDDKDNVINEVIKNGDPKDRQGDIYDQLNNMQVNLKNFNLYIQSKQKDSNLKNKDLNNSREYIISPLTFSMKNQDKVFCQTKPYSKENVEEVADFEFQSKFQGQPFSKIFKPIPIQELQELRDQLSVEKCFQTFGKLSDDNQLLLNVNKIQLEKLHFSSSDKKVETGFKINFRVREFPEYLAIIQSVIRGYNKVMKSLNAEKYVDEFDNINKPTDLLSPSLNNNGQLIAQTTLEPSNDKKQLQISVNIESDQQKIVPIQELIKSNLLKDKKPNDNDDRDLRNEEKSEVIKCVKFDFQTIDTNGIEICLLDDLTSLFTEPLVTLYAKNLDMRKHELDLFVSQNMEEPDTRREQLNIIQQNQVCESMLKVLEKIDVDKVYQTKSESKDDQRIKDDLKSKDDPKSKDDLKSKDDPIKNRNYHQSWTKFEIEVEISYYNHKSFMIERMLEPYNFVCLMSQQKPTEEALTKVTSDKLFNLNLTYGFVHSMLKVIFDLCPPTDSSSDLLFKMASRKPNETSCQLLDNDNRENYQVEEDEQKVERKKVLQKLLPKFRFNNRTRKKVSFYIFNESDTKMKKVTGEQKLDLELDEDYDNKELQGAKLDELISNIMIYDGVTEEQIKNTQLYFDFQIEGYNRLKEIPLNFTGVYGFRIQSQSKKTKSCIGGCSKENEQNIIIRIEKDGRRTQVYFESSTIIQNIQEKDLSVCAVKTVENQQQIVDVITLAKDQVRVVPLSWFEQNYQVFVDRKESEYPSQFSKSQSLVHLSDKSVQPVIIDPSKWETIVEHQTLFKRGKIKEVLDPKITNPYYKGSHPIKLSNNKGWLSMDLALLNSRNKSPQFLIIFMTLTNIKNSTFHPIYINSEKVTDDEQIKTDSEKTLENLNLESTNELDRKFSLKIKQTTQHQTLLYKNERQVINFNDKPNVYKMSQNKGQRIPLSLEGNQQYNKISDSFTSINTENISCIIEKIEKKPAITDSEGQYGSLSQRVPIFHQSSCQDYVIYQPFCVINATKHKISFYNTDKTPLSDKSNNKKHFVLDSQQQSYFDFKDLKTGKMRIKIKDYELSDVKDFFTAGVHGVVDLKPSRGQKQNMQDIQIGIAITTCDSPYDKTRVIRFTTRFTVYNSLSQSIVIKQEVTKDRPAQYLIKSQGVCELDISLLETRKTQLYIRQATEEEKKDLKDSEDSKRMQYEMKSDNFSKAFEVLKIGDFQLYLPHSNVVAKHSTSEKQDNWNRDSANNRSIIRVLITTDPNFSEKYYCIIARPSQPDYLLLNYLPYKVTVADGRKAFVGVNQVSIPAKHKTQDNKELPGGVPLIIDQSNQKKKIEINIEGSKQSFKYSIIDPKQPENVKINHLPSNIYIRSRVKGSVRIIELLDQKGGKEDQPNQTVDTRSNLIKETLDRIRFDKTEAETTQIVWTKMVLELAGLGISLIDFKPHELCYISFDTIKLKNDSLQIFQETKKDETKDSQELQEMSFELKNFQIDAMQNEVFPVLLGPRSQFKNIEREYYKKNKEKIEKEKTQPLWLKEDNDGRKPLVMFKVEKDISLSDNIKTEKYLNFEFELQPLEFKLHLSLIIEIQQLVTVMSFLLTDLQKVQESKLVKELKKTLDILNENEEENHIEAEINESKENNQQQTLDKLTSLQIQFSNNVKTALPKGQRVFLENVLIKMAKLNLTLRIRGIESILKFSGLLNYIINLGSNFGDITDAEFLFTEMQVSKQNVDESGFLQQVTDHYKHQAINQFYQVLGSQDIIGNPSGFMASINSGTEEFYNEPLEGLVHSDIRQTYRGVQNSVMKICTSTIIAMSSSLQGISGSAYLGMRNACAANFSHIDLDRPLTVAQGIKQGYKGFYYEIKDGITGIWEVPIKRVSTQGMGAPQLIKGIAQGTFQLVLCPLAATARLTYGLSTGTKQQMKGERNNGQRYRYPRYFNQSGGMDDYDMVMAKGYTALINIENGRHSSEVLENVFDVSRYNQKNYFLDRVVILTNQHIFFVQDSHMLLQKIKLKELNAIMIYFQQDKMTCLHMEVQGKLQKIQTNMPDENEKIRKKIQEEMNGLRELYKLQEQREKLRDEEQKKKDKEQKNDNSGQSDQVGAGDEMFNQSGNDDEYTLVWETIESNNNII